MLGQLYIPRGKAFETARDVLEVEKPMACNVAMGCSNLCKYCYGDTSNRRWDNLRGIRLPKRPPIELVKKQIKAGMKPQGVFLSFMTDPFIKETYNESCKLMNYLLDKGVKVVATLSKQDCPISKDLRSGMTIVSANENFRKKFEPNALSIEKRIKLLKVVKENGGYAWISIEPYPTPVIWRQDLKAFLEKIDFVDFMIFGKWNYDRRALDKEFYAQAVAGFKKFCEERGIRHSVKTETLRFIG